jgi:hypothetical protein
VLLDWLARRGSVDVISDAGGYTAWFQRGEKSIRASAQTKSDSHAELVLMVSAEGNGAAALEKSVRFSNHVRRLFCGGVGEADHRLGIQTLGASDNTVPY